MAMTKDQLFVEAQSLDPREREWLAEELLLTLDHADRQATDAAWVAEAERREAEFLAQGGKTIPMEGAIARLLARGRP